MKTRTKKFFKISIIVTFILSTIFLFLFTLLYFGVFSGLSSVKLDENKLININTSINIYDEDGNIIPGDFTMDRPLEKIEEIPQHVIDAFVSIEDKDFYKHKGVNYKRIIGALISNLKAGTIQQGASTITQQLIKNTHLTNEKTLSRKINEFLLAQELEKKLDKNEIMENYLNIIYFGSGTFGIEQASKKYFDKSAKDLNLIEGATLAGIIKSPNTYSPIFNKENCVQRRNIVLHEMYLDKKINKEEYEKAINTPLETESNTTVTAQNDYIAMALKEAGKILSKSEKDLVLSGCNIYTYMDSNLQQEAINIAKTPEYLPTPQSDLCISALDNNGKVKAYIAKSIYDFSNIKRQPGSVLKPVLVYAPALEYNIISPISPILDEKCDFNGYSPKNYNNVYHGYVTAKEALSNSYNIPAVKILDIVGLQKSKYVAQKLGIKFDKNDSGYALALGSMNSGVNPIEMFGSYVPFMNGGKYTQPTFIKKIVDKNGNTLYIDNKLTSQAINEDTAYLITDMLKETVKTGTAKKMSNLNIDIASKTGTAGAQDGSNTDIWNISYTPDLLIGVLICNTGDKDNNLPKTATGSNYPTIIAKKLFEGKSNKIFEKPSTVRTEKIDSTMLKYNKVLLATPNTPEKYIQEHYFSIKNIPNEYSTNFTNINNFNIDVDATNDSPIISFDAQNHIEYEVYRKSEDIITLLDTIKGKNGKVEIIDKTPPKGNFYEYFVKAYFAENKNSTTKLSNTVKIFIS